MYTYASEEDLLKVMQPFTPEQQTVVEGYLEQASTNLRGWALDRGYDLDSVIATSTLRAAIATGAVVAAVKRALDNLDGFSETTSTVAIDDYRETTTSRRDASTSTGALTIEPNDVIGLLPRRRNRFGTLRLGAAI